MSLGQQKGYIWFDGEYVPWEEAKVHVLTHTLHYGVGVFEGLRAYETVDGTAIFRLTDHTNRLFNSAHILNMKIPYDKNLLNEVQKEIITKNNLKSGYIRTLVFYGAESLGLHAKNLKTHTVVSAWEWSNYLGVQDPNKGVRTKISSITRHHVNSVFCRAKATGNYINSIMAAQEATMMGFDEAILLDHEGFVAEGSGENIFMVRNGILYTPDLTSVLEGITRDTVCKLAKDIGLTVAERRITRDELYIADEAFFTGTAAEIIPIGEVDGRMIGDGMKGPLTTQLSDLFQLVIRGQNKNHRQWLAYVSHENLCESDATLG